MPRLAPPGAGLPTPELFSARVLFGWFRKTRSKESVRDLFATERERILALVRPLDSTTASQPVLIGRLRGMEDSSRNWSPWMTVEHLRIVNDAIAGTMDGLLRGETPEREASTAAVKPSPDVEAECVDGFEETCRAIEAVVSGVPDLRVGTRFAHPWFGPLDAAGWHAMAAFHMRLHRKQIEEILRLVRAPRPLASLASR